MNSMNYIGKFISNFRDFYNEINAATLTGAIDVVVVQQPDGSFTCSPFHVRFGKLGVLRSREKIVDIEINGEPLDIHMKLGESGEAFFVEEVGPNEEGEEEAIPPHLACSPIPSEDHYEPWMKEDGGKWEEGEKELEAPIVKVFAAETISTQDDDVTREKVRKISIAVGEFRTIETEEKEAGDGGEFIEKENASHEDKTDGKISSNSSSNSLSQMSNTGDKTGGGPSTGGGKRKRRRRSLLKKKNNGGGVAKEGNSGEASKPEEEMFIIDDVTSISHESEATADDTVEPELNALAGDDSFDQLSMIPNPATETDYHFFSDTELTPGCSPESRSFSPVASDSELEQRQRQGTCPVDPPVPAQSWNWGELPSPPSVPRSQATGMGTELAMEAREEATPKTEKQKQEEAQKSMLSGMFSFMKKTKHLRHGQATEGGIYLSELNPEDMDPEVAALYFSHSYRGEGKRKEGCEEEPDRHREEDAESGNGPSIPQSPSSHSPTTVEGAERQEMIDMMSATDRGVEGEPVEVAISLCGHLDSGLTEDLFNMYVVSYDDFVHNPMMIENPDLVVRMNGKYYNWTTACPLVMCMSAFRKPLPPPVVNVLSHELNKSESSQQSSKDKKPMESTRSYSSWFYWRRSSDTKSKEAKQGAEPGAESPIAATPLSPLTPTTPKEETDAGTMLPLIEESVPAQTETELTQRLEQVGLVDEEKEEGYAGSNSSEESDGGGHKGGAKIPLERRFYQQALSDKFRKTLRLSSDQLARLNLKDGANEVVFSVTTAYQGTSRCKCHVYKWNFDDRIVISDIDGTITKSDVLGHILPIVGKDWAQSGVAQLFTKIKDNGYKLLYLSARAIGQARVTRDYLRSIKQGDLSLPDGPLLLNPTSLISAFHREVIEKKPEEFKISCLRDISALFPPDLRPFYAGYGNRVNDVWAYRAVGIPIVRIFTINYKGELKHELTQTFQSSYTKMCQLVDEMFPPPAEDVPEDFSNFVYWRDPIPELQMEVAPSSEAKPDPKNKKT